MVPCAQVARTGDCSPVWLEKYWSRMFHCFLVGNVERNRIFPARETIPQKRSHLEECFIILKFQMAVFQIADGRERQEKNSYKPSRKPYQPLPPPPIGTACVQSADRRKAWRTYCHDVTSLSVLCKQTDLVRDTNQPQFTTVSFN